MGKFLVTKKVSLDFLGDKWKEENCFVEFQAFTISDVKDDFSAIGEVDSKDTNSVAKGVQKTLDLLERKFVSGKGIGEDGKVIDITKEDLGDLPAEVIPKLLGFLSESIAPKEVTPSETL